MPQPDDPLSRAYRSGGMDRLPAPDRKPEELMGFSGFPGIAQETGRVVRGVAGAGKLYQGYILVTEHARPSWMLLFAQAVALVTDDGGFMSHSPVAARE
jgi:phosphoenolpyruvate synthase/pyruvate phosphate dikinase